MTQPDLKKLTQAAADTARAHRDATRLLLQGIDDAMHADSDAVREFFVDPTNHDTLAEVNAFTNASHAFLNPVKLLAVRAIANEVRRRPDMATAVKKYEAITEEVQERVNDTCPCRGCTKSRNQTVKVVDDCLRKIRERAKEEK